MTPEREKEIREYWKPIPGFEDRYEVSNLGNVRALRFVNGKSNFILKTPKLKSLIKWGNGYRKVSLCDKPYLVHRLVLLTFVGPAPIGHEAAHLDGDRSNNKLHNLQWVSRKENHSHKVLHGTAQRGENNSHSTLTEALVLTLRDEFSKGVPQAVLAKKYELRIGLVHDVVRRKKWKHVY